MNRTPDTSVLVAALTAWHPRHAQSRAAVSDVRVVLAHVLIESYSVLTRLPAPHRIRPGDAAAILTALPWEIVTLPPEEHRDIVTTAAEVDISGGAVYDALIAATARHHRLTLVTSDTRARRTYAATGTHHVVP